MLILLMTMQYTLEEFERFAKGIKKASDIIKSQKPDYIFAPVVGAVPFIDFMYIADRHFDLTKVEYPPNSSRFSDRGKYISTWYRNFLNTNYHGDRLEIICIDEVISGASAIKGYEEFKKALYEFQEKKKEKLERKIFYSVLGISEKPRKGDRNYTLKKLVNSKKAKLIDVGRILTADNIDLNHIRLKVKGENYQGRHIYLPEIEKFYVSEHYLTLLQNLASFFGVDSSTVTPQNLGRIKNSLEKYLIP